MLVGFRGRCSFRIYMPNKPNKYGLKIMILTDARTSYMYNGYIYTGRNSDGIGLPLEERILPVPTQSVLRLAQPIYGSNRNITASFLRTQEGKGGSNDFFDARCHSN
ncbi:Transposase IS4 [Popillia japonica]|uniref:Transposase IS4 n=1 Tax=Popillia japonica TaxID=7064 RepID=A0AAW1IAB6_POPJA